MTPTLVATPFWTSVPSNRFRYGAQAVSEEKADAAATSVQTALSSFKIPSFAPVSSRKTGISSLPFPSVTAKSSKANASNLSNGIGLTALQAKPAAEQPFPVAMNGLENAAPAQEGLGQAYQPHIIDLVHINDYHEAFSVLPRIVTAMRQLSAQSQQQGHIPLRFDIGDNNIANEAKDWALNISLLNQMHLDAGTLGNHEFDLGVPLLSQGLMQANYPSLVANMSVPGHASLIQANQRGKWLANSMVLERQGERFGIIGVVTPTFKKLVHSGVNFEGVEPLNLEQTAAVVQAQVNQLEAMGINKIILLSHMGYEADLDLINPSKGGVTGLDVIVGGHSHTELSGVEPGKNLFQDSLGQPVFIVQTGKNGHHVGLTQVVFDAEGWVHPISADLLDPKAFLPDSRALATIDKAFGPDRPIAQLDRPYDNSKGMQQEDPMADLFADYLLLKSGADMAFVKADSIRDDAEGVLTRRKLREMLPFKNKLVVVKLKGKAILDTYNDKARQLLRDEHHPALLHPSANLHIQLNKATGQLDKLVWKNPKTELWEPIDPNKNYTVALDDYVSTSPEFPHINGAQVVSDIEGDMVDNFEAAIRWRLQRTQHYRMQTGKQLPGHTSPNPSLPYLEVAPDGRLTIISVMDNTALNSRRRN